MQIKRIASGESDLVVGLFDKYRVFYKQPSDQVLAENFITERLINNESVIFVAMHETNGKIIPVGFAQLYPLYSSVRAIKNWILNDLYVEREYRKQGAGEKLIKASIDFAKENKAKFIQLETATDNFPAQSLYEAIGFKRQEQINEFYIYRMELN
ncbi:MAG: GNAT family N-acetyltransferase [Bacteroidota bacterium]